MSAGHPRARPGVSCRFVAVAPWFVVSLVFASLAAAQDVDVPVQLDYAFVHNALTEAVFVEADESRRLYDDGRACNALVVARPHPSAAAGGAMNLRLDVEAEGGTPLGDRCILRFTWRGQIELEQDVYLGDEPGILAFRVRDSRLLSSAGGASIPGILWTWIKQFVHPRLDAFSIDLSTLLGDSAGIAASLLQGAPPAVAASVVESLHLASPTATDTGIEVRLRFAAPPLAAPSQDMPPPPDAMEIAAWVAAWQSWDAFATWAIASFAGAESGELRAALMETLLAARYALRDFLVESDTETDPVRSLFLDTWERLAPLIAEAARAHDTATALRYMSFIGAGDALRALEAVAAPLGVRVDRATLLTLARTLNAAVDPRELDYDLDPDPELRRLFGLPPDPPEPPADAPTTAWLDFWIPSAFAADDLAALGRRLDNWVPRPDEREDYFAAVGAVLGTIRADSLGQGRVASPYAEVYGALLSATAWQESCWRQYEKRAGEVRPLQSAAGSVGLMQVNRHVWRQVYDIDKLERDLVYNARAGDDILVHYLVDYAIKRKEHEVNGSLDDLARATYAVYNGGPRHLDRYRRAETKPALRAIDTAFWRKYQAVKESPSAAVRACTE